MIEIPFGDDRIIPLQVQTADGAPINLTGATLRITLVKHMNDETAIFDEVITNHTNATNGESSFELNSGDYDITNGVFILCIRLLDVNQKKITITRENVSFSETPKVWGNG